MEDIARERELARAVTRFERRAARGGRNACAFYADIAICGAFILVFAYLGLRELGQNSVAAAALAAIIACMAGIIARIVYAKRARGRKARARRALCAQELGQKLLLMSEEDFLNAANGFARALGREGEALFAVQRAGAANMDDMLCAYRRAKAAGKSRALLICASKPTEKSMGNSCIIDGVTVEVYAPPRLVQELEGAALSEEDLAGAILAGERARRRILRRETMREALSGDRSRAYMLTGFLLVIVSLFTRYAIYFRLLGALCITLGAVLRFFKRRK